MSPRRLLKICLPTAALLIAATTVWGFWSTQGAGTASATVGTLNPPTNVSVPANVSAGTVHVNWSASALGGGGVSPTGYYVTRIDNSDSSTSNACGTNPSSLVSSTSCDDTAVPDGTYHYAVTAVYRTWTATGTSGDVAVAATLDHFAVSTPASATAGAPFDVTITAKDASNNTMTGYTGTIHFTSSDSGAPDLPSNYNFVAGDHGSHTFNQGATLKTAGSQTVTVNDTSQTSKTGTATISVSPAAADHFKVTAPATATAGTAFNTVTLTAQDAYNNTATGYANGNHTITWSGASTSPGGNAPNYPTSTVSFTNGVSTTTLSATLFAAGSNNLTATASSPSLTGTATISVSPAAADHFKVTAPATATAGTAFNTVTLTAQDAYNNTATGYANGNHTITWSGASTSPGGNAPNYPTSTVSFTNGVSTTTLSATLFAAGSNNLTATASSPSLTGTATISVSPAAADHFKVTAPATATAGTAFNTVTLTAQDAYNNTATGYANGNHTITWSGASTSPGGNAPNYPTSTVSFTNGVSTTTLSATLFAAGSNNLTATASSPSLTGTATISVNSAGVILSYNRTCPVSVAKGSSTGFTINVPNDAYGNSFRNTSSIAVGLTLSNTANFGFGAVGTGTTTVNITTGPANNTFTVVESGANKTATLTATAPTGFTAPPSCTINAGP